MSMIKVSNLTFNYDNHPDNIFEDVFKELTKLDVIGQIKNGQVKNDESYIKILESIEYVPKKNFFLKVKENSKLLTSIVTGIHS